MYLGAGPKDHGPVHQHGGELAVDDDHGGQGEGLDAAHYESDKEPKDLPVRGELEQGQKADGLGGLQALRHGRLLH